MGNTSAVAIRFSQEFAMNARLGVHLGLSLLPLYLLAAFLLSACGPQEALVHTSDCPAAHFAPHETWREQVTAPETWMTSSRAAPALNLLAALEEGYGDVLGSPSAWAPLSTAASGTETLFSELEQTPEAWRASGGPWSLGRRISAALESAVARTGQRDALLYALRASLSSTDAGSPGLAQLVAMAANDPAKVNPVSVATVLLKHEPDVPLKAVLCEELEPALQIPAEVLTGPDKPCPAAARPPTPPPSWTDVRPVLLRYCTGCHGADSSASGHPEFRLDLYESAGGVKGAFEMASRIKVRAVTLLTMPPPPYLAGQIITYPSAAERGILGAWVDAAAPGPAP